MQQRATFALPSLLCSLCTGRSRAPENFQTRGSAISLELLAQASSAITGPLTPLRASRCHISD